VEAPDFWLALAVGFLAQMVDGALGMAYGTVSTSVLLAFGVPPATASAMVHTAELFTTGASGASHIRARNVDWSLVRRLAPAGMVGAVLGAALVFVVPGKTILPFVSVYLFLLGVLIIVRALRTLPGVPGGWRNAVPLGFVGGFLDAAGGGGWGPIVTSTLLGRGHAPRQTIGSVNTTEFLVAAAAVTTFAILFARSDISFAQELVWSLAGLILGGVLAAPFAAVLVRVAPRRVLMVAVGLTVIGLSAWQMRTFVVWAQEMLSRGLPG